MKALKTIPFILLVFILLSVPAQTQESLWNELNAKVVALYQQGRYSEAAKVAEEALKVAEKTFGTDHPNAVLSVFALGRIYHAQGKYTESEPLYKQSLKIWEKALGPDHPDVAASLKVVKPA